MSYVIIYNNEITCWLLRDFTLLENINGIAGMFVLYRSGNGVYCYVIPYVGYDGNEGYE